MKQKRLTAILIAILIVFFISQGALAAGEDPTVGPAVAAQEAQLDEIMGSIEADRSAVVDDLVYSFTTDDKTAEQLRATLDGVSASTLAEIAQNASSLDDVNSMLSEDIFRLGDIDRDMAYTPVPPCRILDTRIAGGAFNPGTRREFYVYGSLGFQGGSNCFSPNGEPGAVHLYIVSVPVAGQGNFAAFPANLSPSGSVLNYRAGVQNIGNAATIKTYDNIGPPEIEFENRFGVSHLVVDVLGYYHGRQLVAGADFAASSDNEVTVTTPATVKSVSITAPASGKVIVNASGYFFFSSSLTADGGRCSISSAASSAIDFSHLIIADDSNNTQEFIPFAATRGFNVNAGTTTFRLNCDRFSGNVRIGDPTINATWVPRTY